MIVAAKYKGKTVGVLGLGKTGISAIKSLLSGGAEVIAWDDNAEKCKNLKIDNNRLHCGLPKEEDWEKMSHLIISPGVPFLYPKPHHAYVKFAKHDVQILSDLDLLQEEQHKASYIGITGTNGKSTTTSLISHILRASQQTIEECGNIGNPVLGTKPLNNKSEYYVIEASSFQLDLVNNTKFNIAVCLNITEDHLDRHKGMEKYIEAKSKIFANQDANDFAIVSINNKNSNKLLEGITKQKLIKISSISMLNNGVSVIDNIIHDNYFAHKSYKIGKNKALIGEHNAENIAAAFAAARAVGISATEIIESLSSFKSLPHRMELVHASGDLNFINDSKATNVNSAYWALNAFDDIYWISGGKSKNENLEKLIPLFKKIKHAYLIGEVAPSFSAELKKHRIPNTVTGNLENALKLIKDSKMKKGNVLLSPACSSFDQWKNFEERGASFAKLVKENW